jgi:hypothetical protein
MPTRRASCSCGQLTLEVEGDPVRVSICHCLACQRRTGSVFGMQARWRREQVRIEGDATEYVRSSDEGEERSFFFCPRCGATVYYQLEPKHIGVPVGAFADPTFPRAAHLGVGGLHAPVGRPARRDRARRAEAEKLHAQFSRSHVLPGPGQAGRLS